MALEQTQEVTQIKAMLTRTSKGLRYATLEDCSAWTRFCCSHTNYAPPQLAAH